MKILHVETGRHFYGGPQQVMYLMSALQVRGHECTLVCPPGSGIDTAARATAIPVRNLFCAGDLDLPFAYRLTQYINESQPDILHCHSRRGADVLGGLAASFADVPAVVSRRVDNTEMQLVAALRYRPFRRIIAISETIAAVLRDHGIDGERIAVIRSAVDSNAFAGPFDCDVFRREFGLPDDALVIGAAGQLIERKGYRYLLDAVAALAGTHPPLRVLLFGEGPLEERLREQAARLAIDGIVNFPGFRDDLDRYLGCFDIFAHPALSEGLGVATLKAQAAGVPVVGFAAGGLVEAVEHETSGLLVAPEDADALARALASLIVDPDLRERMGEAGRERARREFSIDAMADAHAALYREIVDAHG